MTASPTARIADGTQAYGHKPTVFAAFLHFDLSFMIWVLLGALGVSISESLGLSAAQKGLIVAVPILSGSLMRIPLGLLSDRFGGRRVGIAMLLALYLPLLAGWRAGTSLGVLIAVGLMLGVAGASFAVVLPLASRWYPPERQGLVMGIAAAGNSGTVVANLVAPRIAAMVGWHGVLALTTIPLTIVLIVFAALAKDSPTRVAAQSLSSYLAVLRERELWWFCLFYSVTFGGYVGLELVHADPAARSVPRAGGDGGLSHCARCAGGKRAPPARRIRGRPRRRRATAVGALPRHRDDVRCGIAHPCPHADGGGARDGDGLPRARQRRRVPARAAVLPSTDRHRDGCGRRGGRTRRIHASDDARPVQAAHRLVRRGIRRARLMAAIALLLLRWLMATNANWMRSWRRSEVVGERAKRRAA